MARPVKWRKIGQIPQVLKFIPADSDRMQGANSLKLEELEAIRLKDLQDLDQIDCAREMGVSRPTFQRILLSARWKIADSLVNGKAIQIDGGHYTRNICPIRCLDCGREWQESYEKIEQTAQLDPECPKCHSKKLACCPEDSSPEGACCQHMFRVGCL
ncbi:MAG: DUF134 domain-containing protein [Eubacteriales bacterium]|nr:DUF134 domain-containing protein [Eubacteriales bacterium]